MWNVAKRPSSFSVPFWQRVRTEVWIEHAERVEASWCLGVLVKFSMSGLYILPILDIFTVSPLAWPFVAGIGI